MLRYVHYYMVLLFSISTVWAYEKQPTPPFSEKLIKQGKAAYMSSCITCHHVDPQKKGAIGPEIAFSSWDLLNQKVLYGKYPVGYRPKRSTHLMKPLPGVRSKLPALFAYLNSFSK